MKKAFKWIVGIVLGLFLFLLGLGLIGKWIEPESKGNLDPKPTSDTVASAIPDSESADAKALADLKQTLEKRGLTLCGTYKWIGDSELKVSRDLEAKYGVAQAMKMSDEKQRGYDKAWKAYSESHNIPDSLRMYINVFGLKECQ